MFDVIIIGSGPAGLTAAIYTSRASLKTLIFAGNKWGGQLMLTTEVENFPGFPDGIMGPMLMANMRKQAERFGAKALDEEVTSVNFSKQPFRVCTGESSETKISSLMNSTGSSLKPFSSSRRLGSKIVSSGDTKKVSVARSDSAEMSTSRKGSVGASKKDFSGDFYQAKSIIVATGADTVWLGIPGERKLIGRGVSSCAPCDAFFFKNKKVIVVGGGDSAMEEALVLTKFAESVTIVHRRDSFRASAIMATKVQHHPKVEIIWNTTVEEIVGSEKVEKIKLKTGEKVWEMPIDGVFVAIGHKPNTALFKDILQIDKKGYIRKCQVSSPPSRRASIKYQNEKQKYPSMTSVEGVFVAGDVHDYTYRQAITAAGFGCEAAMDVERWLEEQR